MTSPIEALVQQLDGDDDSYGARARLVALGGDATLAISDGLPALGRFGRLTAIEVFEEVADPRCGPVRRRQGAPGPVRRCPSTGRRSGVAATPAR